MAGSWELIDDGSFNGVRKYIRAGTDDDSVDVKHEFHGTQTLVDRNKALQNEDFDHKDDMWHAASIPVQVIYEWIHKFGVNVWNPDHADAAKKLLNSSEYRWCKVKHIIL